MNEPGNVTLPPAVLSGLKLHLQATCSALSIEQAIILAIAHWQSRTGAHCGGQSLPGAAAAGGTVQLRGYHWKSLFLPDATQLRMHYRGEVYNARVEGDHIVYQGRRVSPRELVMSIAPNVRNPWLDLLLRFPDSRHWKRASACRRELEQARTVQPPTPAEAMASAAAAMSGALETALALVRHTAGIARPKSERRLDKHRRASDLMGEDCSVD